MSDSSQDREMKALFEGLRAEDEGRTPDFADMMARARADASVEPRRSAGRTATVSTWVRLHQRWAWAGGTLAAAAVAALMLVGRPTDSELHFEQVVQAFESDPAGGSWTSPTDGLLSVPGTEFVTSMPRIGTPSWPGRTDPSRPRSQL